jgi:phosphatidylserine/phosphatidylglycerophosphate/cardiolipin synthase-like enzyme
MSNNSSNRRTCPWQATLLLGLTLLVAWGLTACVGAGVGSQGITETVIGDYIVLYFTIPSEEASPASGGLGDELAAFIDTAQERVDVAAYDLDLDVVADAMIRAHEAGVRVRLVTDETNAGEDAVTRLRQAGIPVVARPDSGAGIMHDKFVVVDGQWVWTGSWNLTENGTYRNNNHAVLIASRALAEDYATEFDELFASQFGPSSPATTAYPVVNIQTDTGTIARVEVYFAPEDSAREHITSALSEAESNVRFLAFMFTSEPLADTLVELVESGVQVEGVAEARSFSATYSQIDRLQRGGAVVLPDGNPHIMHHKVMIIDDQTVILGSYNFTLSAETTNDENVLIIHDPDVAAAFLAEFDRVRQEALTAQP